jgi:transposase
MSSPEGHTPATGSGAQPQPGSRAHPSDLTDDQWGTLSQTLRDPAWGSATELVLPERYRISNPPSSTHGRNMDKRSAIEAQRRAVVNAIRYQHSTGCDWSALPPDFPPWQQAHAYSLSFERFESTLDHVLADLPSQDAAPVYASEYQAPSFDAPTPGYSSGEQRGGPSSLFASISRRFSQSVQSRSGSGPGHARRSSVPGAFSSIVRTFRRRGQSHAQAPPGPERGPVAEGESGLPPAYAGEFGEQAQVSEPLGGGAQLDSGLERASTPRSVDSATLERRLERQQSIEGRQRDEAQRRSAEHGQGNDGR